jgi:nicotinic acid phosphoribosyltransferase
MSAAPAFAETPASHDATSAAPSASIINQFVAAMQNTDPRFQRLNGWYSTGQPREIFEARLRFHDFLQEKENWTEFCQIVDQFKIDPVTGNVVNLDGTPLSASAFNDYYKFSMGPTIDSLQKLRGGRATVTFALDIRDEKWRKMFEEDTDGITTAVIHALNALQNRTFDYQLVLDTVAGKPFEPFFHSAEGRALFLNADGSPRSLISTTAPHGVPVHEVNGVKTVICSVPILNPTILAPGQVVISVFKAGDAKTGKNRLHVEVTGDANLASYLETTMMQTVYQTALNHHLAKSGCSFGQWLYETLFRFYLSATFAGTQCPEMTGFLFAGRRTGHFLLLLLQAFLATKIPGAKIAGTSSFDAVHFLTKKLGFDPASIIGSVGTHAHELQMLAQALFAWLDKHAGNPEYLPLSACVSTYLYYLTANQGKPGPMPILPDTLGTRSFMKAAECFMVHPMKDGVLTEEWVSLLELVNSARQDSGDIGEFAQTMREYPAFKGTLMASEIDDAEKLIQARNNGYKTFGAGGFMGDSTKPWDVNGQIVKDRFSLPMAVKVIRVWLRTKSSCGTCEICERCLSPCKIGDGTDPAKVTADAILPKPMYDEVITDAQLVKSSAEKKPHSDHLFYCEITDKVRVIRDLGTDRQVELI